PRQRARPWQTPRFSAKASAALKWSSHWRAWRPAPLLRKLSRYSNLRGSDRHQFHGLHSTDELMAASVVNFDRKSLAGLPTIAVEYHDPIAVRAAGHLHQLGLRAGFDRFFARPLDEHVEGLADELLLVFVRNRILHCQQPLIPLGLD